MGATRFAAAAALAAVLARCAPAAAQMTVMGSADHVVLDYFAGEDCSGKVTTHVWPKVTECQGPYIAAGPDDDATHDYCYEGDSECDGVDVDGKMAPGDTFYTSYRTDCEEKITHRWAFTDAKCKKPMGGKKNQIFIDSAPLDKSCVTIYDPDHQATTYDYDDSGYRSFRGACTSDLPSAPAAVPSKKKSKKKSKKSKKKMA